MAAAQREDLGRLIARVGLGAMFMVHGYPKITGGPAHWTKLGGALEAFGLDLWPTFFGFCASIAEFLGGLCLALGVAFRPALALMFVTMVVAAASHFHRGDGLARASHAIEAAVVFLALWFIGPGRYRLKLSR